MGGEEAAGEPAPVEGSLTFEGSSGAGSALTASQPLAAAQPIGERSRAAGTAGYSDLSRVGPLQLALVSMRVSSAGGSDTSSGRAGSSGSADVKSGSSVAALFEVTPLRSSPENSEGWCSVAGWPLRALNPARTAADTLLRYQAAGQEGAAAQQDQAAAGSGEEGAAAQPPGNLCILSAEPYSREAQDWCVQALSPMPLRLAYCSTCLLLDPHTAWPQTQHTCALHASPQVRSHHPTRLPGLAARHHLLQSSGHLGRQPVGCAFRAPCARAAAPRAQKSAPPLTPAFSAPVPALAPCTQTSRRARCSPFRTCWSSWRCLGSWCSIASPTPWAARCSRPCCTRGTWQGVWACCTHGNGDGCCCGMLSALLAA